MNLFNEALSIQTVNRMTVTVYPQLIHIERDGHYWKYVGYSKKEAIKLFRNKYPVRNKTSKQYKL